jgi:hypothetical protein
MYEQRAQEKEARNFISSTFHSVLPNCSFAREDEKVPSVTHLAREDNTERWRLVNLQQQVTIWYKEIISMMSFDSWWNSLDLNWSEVEQDKGRLKTHLLRLTVPNYQIFSQKLIQKPIWFRPFKSMWGQKASQVSQPWFVSASTLILQKVQIYWHFLDTPWKIASPKAMGVGDSNCPGITTAPINKASGVNAPKITRQPSSESWNFDKGQWGGSCPPTHPLCQNRQRQKSSARIVDFPPQPPVNKVRDVFLLPPPGIRKPQESPGLGPGPIHANSHSRGRLRRRRQPTVAMATRDWMKRRRISRGFAPRRCAICHFAARPTPLTTADKFTQPSSSTTFPGQPREINIFLRHQIASVL